MQVKFEEKWPHTKSGVEQLRRCGLDLSGPDYEPKVVFVDVTESVRFPLTSLTLWPGVEVAAFQFRNIYVKQSNTTFKDANTLKATRFG
jgi:hypothetical protein